MMQLIDIHSIKKAISIGVVIRIIAMMIPVFTAFICNSSTMSFTYGSVPSEQIKQGNVALSEFHYRGDSIEHEYKKRISRKIGIACYHTP